MPLLLRLSLLLSLLPSFVTAKAQTSTVVYTHTGGDQQADFYAPAGSAASPVILYIHGGSWRSGSRKDFRRLATDLAAKGYAGFAINYDLAPHSYPTSWLQARDAVQFLRDHAAEYHVDPANIIVAGASAGGELAALLALAPEGPTGAGDHHAEPVKAAILLSGVYDLTGSYSVIERYLGGTCIQVHDACLESSPMQHIHPGTPPFFIGHGTSDHTVPYISPKLFTSDMRAAGNDVTFYTAASGPHMYFTRSRYYADNLAALEAFLAHVAAL